jgi:spermidine synthase
VSIITPLRESREMVRNFYGSLRVNVYEAGLDGEHRGLIHGTVTHGVQFTTAERTREPTSYYGNSSGVGLAMTLLEDAPRKVGIVGLGAGTLASYAQPGDLFRFYEINPLVADLARREFTFLKECEGETEILLGDGRLLLEREADQHYDLLVVDAFSGDSIPVHLLTVEAVRLYFRHLKRDGILALHTSNTHLDLRPVVERIAASLGKKTFCVVSPSEEGKEIYGADWVLLTSHQDLSENPWFQDMGAALQARPGTRAWTDDYSNLFQILK